MQKPIPEKFSKIKSEWVLLALLLVLAAAVRLFDLTDIPLDFHPARQFHSAIIARGIYTEWGGEYPDQQAALNRAQNASEIRIEPPFLEYLTAFTYKFFGREFLWAARIYSIIFWLVGGIVLYFLLKRVVSSWGALTGLVYFFFLPYGILASRSFQPDPLMLMLVILSLYAFFRWNDEPDWKNTIFAGLAAGAAILVKQVAVFFVMAALGGLLISKPGFKRLFTSGKVWIMFFLSLLPVALYNFYGIFIEGSLAGQYSERFFPELFIDPGFYIRWIYKIEETNGLALLMLAVLGVLLLRRTEIRNTMFAYLAGYALYGFVFAHHISTHDYYQLPLFFFTAFGLASLADLLFRHLQDIKPVWFSRVVVFFVFLLGTGWGIWSARSVMKKIDYRELPQVWQEFSQTAGGPGTATIGLMEDYGASLEYWGYILPQYWWSDEEGDLIRNMKEEEFVEIFERRTEGKKYFIITDFSELENQLNLKLYLYAHYPVFLAGEQYLIYDLQNYRGE